MEPVDGPVRAEEIKVELLLMFVTDDSQREKKNPLVHEVNFQRPVLSEDNWFSSRSQFNVCNLVTSYISNTL